MEENKVYTIVKRVEYVIEVQAPTRKAAHEAVNAKDGVCIDAHTKAQFIVGVRSLQNQGTPVAD